MDRAEKERKWQEVIDDLDAEKRNSRCGTVNECLGKDKCDYHNTNGPKDLCSWLCTDILDEPICRHPYYKIPKVTVDGWRKKWREDENTKL